MALPPVLCHAVFANGAAASRAVPDRVGSRLDSVPALGQDMAMRPVSEFGFLVLVGTVLALLGPYGTALAPAPGRVSFWLFTVVTGGLVGIALDLALRRRIAQPWRRTVAVSVVMTPPVTLIVLAAMNVLLGHAHAVMSLFAVKLLWQVFVICLGMMSLRTLVQRKPLPVVETRTVFMPPVAEAEAKLRGRLSAKRRSARLLALEAHDHYVRVHTDAGVELLSLRFSDAMEELSGAYGFRVHRSWWVAAGAIKRAQWRRASGELELEDGSVVPISRSGAPLLREAGWL